jgi:hypothetical protein
MPKKFNQPSIFLTTCYYLSITEIWKFVIFFSKNWLFWAILRPKTLVTLLALFSQFVTTKGGNHPQRRFSQIWL